MSARSRPSSPSTTHGSISHDSSDDAFDIPERLRLHRQMSLELGHPSYASSTGEHEDDDTVGSFDIEGGAGAMSTMHRFQNMLPQQSPSVLDSKIINGHFADFTMDGVPIMPDYSENSIEIGRNNSKQHSSRQMSTTPKGPYNSSAANNNSYLGVGSAAAARRNIRAASKQTQSPKVQPLKPTEQERGRVESQSRQPFSIDGDESTIGSIDRPQSALNTRFVGQPKKSVASKRIPSISVQPEATDMLIAAAQEANAFHEGRRSAPPATSMDQQGTVRRNIPSGFKTTQEFLGELGLKQPSDTPEKAKEASNKSRKSQQQQKSANMNISLSRAPAGKPAAPNSTYQSFRMPDMTGISDLVSGYTNNEHSTQMENIHQHALHRPIESVPLPQDEKAILLALSMLQEKVKMLEEQKAHDEKRQADLEDNLEHTKQLYSIEVQGRRAAEAELLHQKRADSALGTDNDSERGGWSDDRERLQTKQAIERMKLDNTITTQRQTIENLEQKLQVTKIELRNVTEERNNIVTSLAATVSAQETLREENSYLKSELDRLQRLLQDHDGITSQEIMKLEAKITRYRQKVKRSNDTAKEATTTAKEAMRLLRASRSASIEMKGQSSATATSSRSANVVPQQKAHTHTHTQKKQSSKVQEVERRHVSIERKASSSKAPAPATQSAEQTSRPRRKKVILQEVSESEDEIDVTIGPAFVAGAPEDESMQHHQYNDTTFTEPDKENMEPSNMSIRVPDETLISAVDDDEIALLRAQIEEERMLRERKAAASLASKKSQQKQKQKQRATEPEREIAPEEAQNSTGAAKQKRVFIYCPDDGELTVSDMAESEAEESGADEEEAPAPQPAQQVSDHIQEVIDNLGTHDEMRCTVCRRKAEVEYCKDAGRVANIEHPANLEGPIAPEEVVPVSQRMPGSAPSTEEKQWEEEPTMRPSVAPKVALEKVLQQLQDEFNHLKLDYDAAQTEFLGLDPSLGKRRRKSLTMKMNEMVEELDRKADQIYALYDVAELTHNRARVGTVEA